ncbi:hypothetical protein BDN72DRAFT_40739 [Pluteus cervinus]|uniref:Uncharacterized protein n=1 Tax=Pluteus cervinus TaxID=181527 RepID=A0ACD3BHK9_9AGAR|nr:hypothetical protein BDN72DRAFT_40739 [Pluteus cervinus]
MSTAVEPTSQPGSTDGVHTISQSIGSLSLDADSQRVERQLGNTETSYFLPSRESGVNDMYLHLGCRAPAHLFQRTLVRLTWAILRVRHPLLASRVEMHDYEDIRFVYNVPSSPEEALARAEESLEYRKGTKDELLDSYLNGPRTLSNSRLSYLIVSEPPSEGNEDTQNHDILICTTHFLGDGMALHQFANHFFNLLASKTEVELKDLLQQEWETRCKASHGQSVLPASLEDRLPKESQVGFKRIAERIDFQLSQDKLIGGHAFPRRSGQARRTIVPTIPFDEERTKKILKNCKEHGVSISAATFALCSIAWARTNNLKWELPTMMYSALNLRPQLVTTPAINDSYWFIAIGYFNVVLPAFLPKSTQDVSATFWQRARSAKEQSTDAAKNKRLVSRSREMAAKRAKQARVWAKEDDDKANSVWKAPPPAPKKDTGPPRPPSNALIGLSLLGNLDGIYKHATFSEIKLHTLTTGSRQRQGGMLMFGYTFVGKLWISLGYDENGFDKDVVDKFWHHVLAGVDEFLG